ncbi:MAG: TonB-dependent receptor, partial [Gemmatimonadaceae bacterium]|nr:TonB-dependent receptor [Gemmatimonadaceae bacterium]
MRRTVDAVRRAVGVALVLGAALGAAPSALAAQAPPAFSAVPSPLDRRISLRLRDVALRDALDRIAVVAHLRLTYASELLPLDRPVAFAGDSVTVGEALLALLAGVPVRAVVAGPEHLVFAPVARVTGARVLPAPAVPLDRVVITGSAAGRSERSLPIALDVIDGQAADRAGVGSFAGALDANVPGIWMWGASPATPLARYGSIRGASSFGVSYPKVYIDGIEVANPLLVSAFDVASLERVEVIRGPQGAALHGADAISGVLNLVTRAEGTGPDAPRWSVRTTTGVANTAFAPQDAVTQEYALGVRGGGVARAGQLALTAGRVGALYPGAAQDHLRATGSARWVTGRSTLRLTGRFLNERLGAGRNPFLSDSALALSDSGIVNPTVGTAAQSVTQYTVGGTLRVAPDERWTHSLVAGVDGYVLSNVTNELTPFPSISDSVLNAASGRADRWSVRGSSVARVVIAPRSTATWTFALEHSALRESSPTRTTGAGAGGPGGGAGGGPLAALPTVQWLTNTGAVAQADLAFRETFYLTAGARLERSDAYLGSVRYTTLPLVGGAIVQDHGTTTLKVRASYGRGMRAPRTANRISVQGGLRAVAGAAALAPEEQSGIEAGFDLFVGRRLTLQATAFDQRATGLIQQVVVVDSSGSGGSSGSGRRRLALEYQNVGAIANRGIEVGGTVRAGRLAFASTFTSVDSRVDRLARRYTGDLRVGDRVLGVPRLTASADVTWSAPRWSATVGAVRAADWIEYDRIELARAYANFDDRFVRLVGRELRGYWRGYDGATRLRASVTRDLGR